MSRPKVYGFCDAGCKYPIPTLEAKEITLSVDGWTDRMQTIALEAVEEDSAVIVTANPDSSIAYTSAGVQCISQGEGFLTFSCTLIPSSNLKVNLLIFGGVDYDI